LGGVLTLLTARARGWQLPASWARARASRSWHSCWHARQTPTATCSHPPTSAGALRALPASRASRLPSSAAVPEPPPQSSAPRGPLAPRGPHRPPGPTQVGELSRRGRRGLEGSRATGEGGLGGRQTDRQGEGPRLPPGAAPAGRWRAAPCQAVIADRLI
jgi:hypothetical protein